MSRWSSRFFHWHHHPEETQAATSIRFKVFVEEQMVPESEELDEVDLIADHLLLFDESGLPVATGRFFVDETGIGHIGRMAVLRSFRGSGAGSAAMRALIRHSDAHGHDEIILDAQNHAIPFYEKFGFVICGEEHLDCGIPHHLMRRLREKKP